jgi:hypothetical protein
LFSVLTEGEVSPRSIMLKALAERPLRRANARIEMPRSSRSIRSRWPTSTDSASFPRGSILTSKGSPGIPPAENAAVPAQLYTHYNKRAPFL